MIRFSLQFETGNAHFTGMDRNDLEREVARILRNAAEKIDEYKPSYQRRLYDINGNVIGEWSLDIEESEND